MTEYGPAWDLGLLRFSAWILEWTLNVGFEYLGGLPLDLPLFLWMVSRLFGLSIVPYSSEGGCGVATLARCPFVCVWHSLWVVVTRAFWVL